MTKKQLKLFYNLYQSINKVEHDLIPSKYIEWGFLQFKEIWDSFYDLYNLFDKEENTLLERLNETVDNMYIYEFSKLKEEDYKKFVKKYWDNESVVINKEFRDKCEYCKKSFNNVDEIIDFIFHKTNNNKK